MHQIRFRLGLRPRPRWEREKGRGMGKGREGKRAGVRGRRDGVREGDPPVFILQIGHCHQTHYRSYRGQVLTGQITQPTVSKHWRKIQS